MGVPAVVRARLLQRGLAKSLAQAIVAEQPKYGVRRRIGVARRSEETGPLVGDHLADLLKIRRDDRLAEPHVLEKLRRRAEEPSPIWVRDVRGDADVAGGEQFHCTAVRYDAGELDTVG